LIDLALPRDSDPAVAQLAGVDVSTVAAANAVLQSEVARHTTWLRRREPALSLTGNERRRKFMERTQVATIEIEGRAR
jgi:glutamyl-tRNA reductase